MGKAGGKKQTKAACVEKAELFALQGPMRVLRNLAVYRFLIFGILVYEYVTYLNLNELPARTNGVGAWFTYDQFEFAYDLAPKQGEGGLVLWKRAGLLAGATAMLGGVPRIPCTFELGGLATVLLYAARFFVQAQAFTNHHYLFLLLGALVAVSGGGSFFPPPRAYPEAQRRRLRRSEWGVVMLRMQYAVVYLYAAAWKWTARDWLDGSICKGIFLSFEEQGVNRGVPWKDLHQRFGDNLFVFVAFGGLALDSAMFVALSWRRPNKKSTKTFTKLSILFHGFTMITMSQRIGYSFPICCLVGSLIFQPIGNDSDDDEYHHRRSKKDDNYVPSKTKKGRKGQMTVVDKGVPDEGNLLEWLQRYSSGHAKARASATQRYFALAWVALQVLLPLRMPLVSRGDHAFTGRGYRFSWTMMLHSKGTVLAHGNVPSGPAAAAPPNAFFFAMDLLNLYPLCAGVQAIPRGAYLPESFYQHADPRTLPLIAEKAGLVTVRHRALLDAFPRYVARAAGGWSDLMGRHAPQLCRNAATGRTRRVAVYGNVHARLNAKGAFCRLFDPTVDLAAVEMARQRRPLLRTVRDVVLDRAPEGYEYFLSGMGSLNGKAEEFKRRLAEQYPQAKKIEIIADRAACMQARPLALWPAGFPLAVVSLEAPASVELTLSKTTIPQGIPAQHYADALPSLTPTDTTLVAGRPESTDAATMIELKANRPYPLGACGDTTGDDVLLAIFFMQ